MNFFPFDDPLFRFVRFNDSVAIRLHESLGFRGFFCATMREFFAISRMNFFAFDDPLFRLVCFRPGSFYAGREFNDSFVIRFYESLEFREFFCTAKRESFEIFRMNFFTFDNPLFRLVRFHREI